MSNTWSFRFKWFMFPVQTFGRTLENGQYDLIYIPATKTLYARTFVKSTPFIEKKFNYRVSRHFMKKAFKMRNVLEDMQQLEQWTDQHFNLKKEHEDRVAKEKKQQIAKARKLKAQGK